MLNAHPWTNEPDEEAGAESALSLDYNRRLNQHTVRYAMLDWLEKKKYGLQLNKGRAKAISQEQARAGEIWDGVVRQHFLVNKEKVLETVKEWIADRATPLSARKGKQAAVLQPQQEPVPTVSHAVPSVLSQVMTNGSDAIKLPFGQLDTSLPVIHESLVGLSSDQNASYTPPAYHQAGESSSLTATAGPYTATLPNTTTANNWLQTPATSQHTSGNASEDQNTIPAPTNPDEIILDLKDYDTEEAADAAFEQEMQDFYDSHPALVNASVPTATDTGSEEQHIQADKHAASIEQQTAESTGVLTAFANFVKNEAPQVLGDGSEAQSKDATQQSQTTLQKQQSHDDEADILPHDTHQSFILDKVDHADVSAPVPTNDTLSPVPGSVANSKERAEEDQILQSLITEMKSAVEEDQILESLIMELKSAVVALGDKERLGHRPTYEDPAEMDEDMVDEDMNEGFLSGDEEMGEGILNE